MTLIMHLIILINQIQFSIELFVIKAIDNFEYEKSNYKRGKLCRGF